MLETQGFIRDPRLEDVFVEEDDVDAIYYTDAEVTGNVTVINLHQLVDNDSGNIRTY